MNEIDDYLDTVKAALIHPNEGIQELSEANVIVWHHGGADPDEDIKNGARKCAGVSVLIYDLGGESDPANAEDPVIQAECAIELFLDPTKRNRRKTPALRKAGQIRDDIMRVLQGNRIIQAWDHSHMEPEIKGYKPLADPDYVCFRIRLSRSILLY